MDQDEAIRLSGQALRLLGRATLKLADEVGELVPPESRSHLIKAQREVFLAAASAIEHRRNPKGKSSRHRPRKIALD